MISKSVSIGTINLPLIEGEFSMIPFDLNKISELPAMFQSIARQMLKGINHSGGTAFFTLHGKKLNPKETLRRGAPHTDGSYDLAMKSWGNGGGWKIGENGPSRSSKLHDRLYNSEKGGIILASNHSSCLGWTGEFDGMPGVGGDCSKIKLNEPFILRSNTIYYGNNHFIHESIPVEINVHRVFARITMPENHSFTGGNHDA